MQAFAPIKRRGRLASRGSTWPRDQSAEAQSHQIDRAHDVKRVLADIDAEHRRTITFAVLPLLTIRFWRIPAKPVGILRLLRVRTCYNSKKSNVD